MADVGKWGPVARGGRGRRWPRFVMAAVLSSAVAAAGATASVASITYGAVTENIERASVAGLDEPEEGRPLHVLVVGSDARDGLSDAERQALSLGTFEGSRSDTVLLVTVSADRSNVSLVSFPRDLVVSDNDGGIAKLTETYGSGRESLVRAVREDLGFPVNHYVEVSITGFIETVEVVGSVEVCLDEPLVDGNSGADLPAGCQDLDPAQALSYVRSRQGATGDFERIERQQQFLRGLVRKILDGRLLLDPGRLVTVAEEVSQNLTVDDGLTVGLMADLSRQMQDALTGGVSMVTVPAFPRDLDDDGASKKFVVAYEPGLAHLIEDLEQGDVPPSRGTPSDRADVSVQLWTGGRTAGAAIVESTLFTGGFGAIGIATGPGDLAGDTVVHPVPGFEEHADWVAAHLGVDVAPLPADVSVPEGHTAVVSIGEDAAEFALVAPGAETA